MGQLVGLILPPKAISSWRPFPVRMPGFLGFGLGWNLLAGREFKPRLRHGCIALAILKNDAPVQHFVSLQCKDSGVPLLGPILGVNFGSSGAQKRGSSY